MFSTNFTTLDWVIVAFYMAAVTVMGLAMRRFIRNEASYLVGGRCVGVGLSTASFIGTGLGLVTLMYAAMDGFTRGFSYLFVPVLGMACPVFLGISGFVIARLRALNLTTIPEYFEHRYRRSVRTSAGLICALAGILNMGLFPKMGATFITFVTGMAGSGSATVTVNVITSVLILLVIGYTLWGGMVAVILTDYVQFVILSIGLMLGTGLCLFHSDLGWSRLTTGFQQQLGEAAFNPVHPESYGWTYVIWMTLVTFAASICWAPEASRALMTKSVRDTQWSFFLGSSGFFARMAIPALWGISAAVLFRSDPALASYFGLVGDAGIQHASEAMPLFLGKLLPTGILGLLVAGLLAAFMSTHDSYMLAWASVIAKDVAPAVRSRSYSSEETIRLTRWCVVAIGGFLLIWGIWYELPDSVWTYMAITGTVYLAGSAPALIGGVYWKRASSVGATASIWGGLTALPALFIDNVQRLLAGIDSSVTDLSADQQQALAEVAGWYNGQTLALATFLICGSLFVIGSLVFPDRRETQ